jgi:hypothetical protein
MYRYAMDGQTLENTARYINYACDPNCEVEKTPDTIWIIALRDITAGEELSYNYGYDARNYQGNPCTCGAQSCCGSILAQEYWALIPQPVQALRDLDHRSAPGITPVPSRCV